MTETRFTWRWLLVIAVVGLFMGLVAGLAAGWIIFPNVSSSNIAGLSAASQNDYIVLVANTYVYDRDTARAKQRLNQLQDKDIKTRVERLAKALGARKDPAAASVADLAIELGSEDSSLRVMAAELVSDSVPEDEQPEATKSARSDSGSDAEPTVKPTKVKKPKGTEVPAAEPTTAPEPTEEPKPTDGPQAQQAAPPVAQAEPTAVPTEAPPPASAAPVTTEFFPSFPDKWWEAVRYIPAQVAPGQQYWQLKYARYCDWAPTDEFNTCEGFPGGGNGVGIWIMTVDESGGCITTDVTDMLNDGSQHPLTTDMLKEVAWPWNPYGYGCNMDYEKEMYGEGNTISVPGMPSDQITNLSLCATSPPEGYNPPPCGHAHVRYFLIFQRATR